MNAVDRMMLSLDGLSVGDAFGETFFTDADTVRQRILYRQVAPPSWLYTDDTEMALSIVDLLRRDGEIDPDKLADSFATRFTPHRDYGGGASRLLIALQMGEEWRREAPNMFGGTGSYGNGAAMRIAPLGAYFADDLDAVRANATRSCEPTHTHPEGIAGALAVAIAAALAWQCRHSAKPDPKVFLGNVVEHVPPSKTRDGIVKATELSFELEMAETKEGRHIDVRSVTVSEIIGSGYQVSAQDTVPFALWCAARHLDNYPDALWTTATGLGDVDTTCAIVGGIVALSAKDNGIPPDWLESREPLPPQFN
jgi:ADP-ribosylglycohydrolase